MSGFKIADGVNVHVIPSEKFNSVYTCVILRQPLTKENAAKNALISQILQRGSHKYQDMKEINAHTERLFGAAFEIQIIKKGENQIIEFYIECFKDELDNCLDFLKEMLLNPLCENGGFKKVYTDSEKENLTHAISARINNKAEYAKLRLLNEMCKDEPFGIYGDGEIEDLKAINEKNCYEHYIHLLEHAPIEIIIMGDVNEGIIANKLNGWYTHKRSEIDKIPKEEIVYKPVDNPNKVLEEKNVNQGKICIGLRTGVKPVSEDYLRLLILNEIFGGGANSRLFAKVREEESLCYSIGSFLFRFKGIMVMQAGVDSKNFEKTIEISLNQLEDLKKGNISDKEFEASKSGLIKKMVGIKDYPGSTIDFYVSQLLLHDENNINDFISMMKNVKKDELPPIAEKIYTDTIYCLK